MTYIPPTEEEIASVLEYWDQVRASVSVGKDLVLVEVTPELLSKVGQHQYRQSALLCTHPEVTYGGGWNQSEMSCTHCDRPLKFLSDIQIEELT